MGSDRVPHRRRAGRSAGSGDPRPARRCGRASWQALRRPRRAARRDLEAARGELVRCIGPNGAGKTTLLSILAGIQQPDDGQRAGSARGRRLGAAAAGALRQADAWPRTCACSRASSRSTTPRPRSPRCWRRPASRDRAGDAGGAALGRQPPARQHRRSGCWASRRCCCSTSRRRALDPRQRDARCGISSQRWRERRHDRHLLDPRRRRGRAPRRPRAGAGRRRAALQRARRRTLGPCGGGRRPAASAPTSRRRSCASCSERGH